MALLSFADSTPRAYRLKVGNASFPSSTTTGAIPENARQGFWNGATPPLGYKLIEVEKRGAKTKKKLDIDPVEAETVRLIYRLAG